VGAKLLKHAAHIDARRHVPAQLGLIERLALLADVPRLVLPAWTGWRIESGVPRPKLVLDDSPAVSLDAAPGERRRGQPRVQLAGRIWFDYAGLSIAADDPAGGAADATHRVFVRRDRAAERATRSLSVQATTTPNDLGEGGDGDQMPSAGSQSTAPRPQYSKVKTSNPLVKRATVDSPALPAKRLAAN
jgi:hypothetical protein